MNDPVFLLLLTAAGVYVFRLWWGDTAAAKTGRPHVNAFPGAVPWDRRAVILAGTGALGLVALETAGEHLLGINDLQSRMTWSMAAYSIFGAPVIEELIFRGWLVVEHRGGALMWSAAVATSALFALLHPFLWRWDETGFHFEFTTKAAFSTASLFAFSVWMYAARLAPWNPGRSLLPCFVGHAVRNAAVVAIKGSQGFLVAG